MFCCSENSSIEFFCSKWQKNQNTFLKTKGIPRIQKVFKFIFVVDDDDDVFHPIKNVVVNTIDFSRAAFTGVDRY